MRHFLGSSNRKFIARDGEWGSDEVSRGRPRQAPVVGNQTRDFNDQPVHQPLLLAPRMHVLAIDL